MAKGSFKKFEKSGSDKKADRKSGAKEGSKADMKADKVAFGKGKKKY